MIERKERKELKKGLASTRDVVIRRTFTLKNKTIFTFT